MKCKNEDKILAKIGSINLIQYGNIYAVEKITKKSGKTYIATHDRKAAESCFIKQITERRKSYGKAISK